MTLDPHHDAAEQAIRDALEYMRRVLIELGHSSYVRMVDHLQAVLNEDREAFYRSVNGGGVWRNMGSIADLGGQQIWQCLVRLASALEAAGLAGPAALEDAA